MKKTLYTLFLLVCLCLTFCLGGCSNLVDLSVVRQPNAFRILRKIDDGGEISIDYVFPLNSSVLQLNGVKNQQIESYKFYLSTFINTLVQNNKARANEGVNVSDVLFYYDVDGLGFSIKFENIDSQKRFFGVESDDKNQSQDVETEGFFVKRQTLKTAFPISSTKSAGDLKLVCVMAISSWCNDQEIDSNIKKEMLEMLNDAVFIYDFASHQKGLKSDLTYTDENGFHNFFVKTWEEIERGDGVEFYMLSPNRPAWYLSALFVVLTGVLIAFLCLKKKKVRKR